MAKTFAVTEFFQRFPDDAACLEYLMKVRYGGRELDCPGCGRRGRFSKLASKPAYQCAWCSHRVHPTVGTPFARSRTPLQKWFYAIYLLTASRRISAKELQRQLGVTYKTAWRMADRIRAYLNDESGGS